MYLSKKNYFDIIWFIATSTIQVAHNNDLAKVRIITYFTTDVVNWLQNTSRRFTVGFGVRLNVILLGNMRKKSQMAHE